LITDAAGAALVLRLLMLVLMLRADAILCAMQNSTLVSCVAMRCASNLIVPFRLRLCYSLFFCAG
jgi:hypothetical protein